MERWCDWSPLFVPAKLSKTQTGVYGRLWGKSYRACRLIYPLVLQCQPRQPSISLVATDVTIMTKPSSRSSAFTIVGLAFVILAATALANWYAPLRKKVSYWLTQQDNELVAAAEAQPTLFALNAFFLYVAAIFIAVFCLSVFG